MTGRPSDFNIWLAHEICERIATTPRGLDFICAADETFPSSRTVNRWLAAHQGFCQSYLSARARQADLLFDECLEIADDSSRDRKLIGGDVEREVTNTEVVARAKLRVDTRMRMAGKLAPKKYGERVALEHSDPNGNPLGPSVIVATMTPQQAAEAYADTLRDSK